MKQMNEQKLTEKLSQYIDGVLPELESKEIESILEKDASLRRQVEELQTLKRLLGSQEVLTPHVGFWTRLSSALEEEKKEEHNLLPFHRKYIPAVATLMAVVAVGLGVLVLQNRMQFVRFFSEKSQAVRNAYEKNLLQGSLMPLFSKIDKDRALQFSLFGTLPLDEKSETALRVDANSKKGYHIDFGKDPQHRTKSVSFNRFMAEIQPTKEQRKVIDSLLELTGKRIQSSVLIGANNAIALAPDLPKLNKVVVTGIASCLEPPQRARFERLLAAHDAPYTVTKENAPVINAERIFQNLPKTQRTNRYVVITPDTKIFSQIYINFDSLRRNMEENMIAIEHRRSELLKKMMARKLRFAPPHVPMPPPSQGVGDENFFSVEIDMSGEENDQSVQDNDRNEVLSRNVRGGQPMHVIIQPRVHKQINMQRIPNQSIHIRLYDDSTSVDSMPLP